jgi:TonB family protein
MTYEKRSFALLALAATGLWGQDSVTSNPQFHQTPDRDGVYYVGPEVTPPTLVLTTSVPYPYGVPLKDVEGFTGLAMVIESNGTPAHIQLLHSHGDAFDQGAIAAVKQSKFEPGKLGGKPVPVWIDVRVVFHANRSQALPQLLIAERDLPPPDSSRFVDKHQKPLSYVPPIPIHIVDADFADPFTKHPFVQVAIISVLVKEDGLPKEVRVRRGLGFGLDKKAEAAVWHYRFLPALRKGRPIEARTEIPVSFVKF